MARIITETGLTKKRYRVVRLVFASQWRTIPGSSFESRAIRSGRPSPMPFRAAQPETGLLRIDIPSLHSRRLADPEAMPENRQHEKMVSDAAAPRLGGGQRPACFGCCQQVLTAFVLVSRPAFFDISPPNSRCAVILIPFCRDISTSADVGMAFIPRQRSGLSRAVGFDEPPTGFLSASGSRHRVFQR